MIRTHNLQPPSLFNTDRVMVKIMRKIIKTLVLMSWIVVIECKMEPFVVGGAKARIRKFPHSAFLAVSCSEDYNPPSVHWICGGSIINEKIILTAAHCLYGCTYKSIFTVSVGHMHYRKGYSSSVRNYLVHERYDSEITANDIALVSLTTDLKFGIKVKRVALMKNPPYHIKAQVAGWGMTNEDTQSMGMLLKYINQHVWETKSCKQVIQSIPRGTICASSGNSDSYSSSGDSGSALVVRGYIQIGIVSYKVPAVSKSLVIYTDTGYFYDWITKNSKKLYCVVEEKLE